MDVYVCVDVPCVCVAVNHHQVVVTKRNFFYYDG